MLGVGVDEEDVIVDETTLEELLVDETVLEVLFRTAPEVWQVVPRSAGSLKVSDDAPLTTPYLVPTAEETE